VQESKLRPAKRVAANQQAAVGIETGLPRRECPLCLFSEESSLYRVTWYRGKSNKEK
jgi:hypothetical protein